MAAGEYVPCPRCYSPNPEKVNFTWWGGMVGPRVLKHVKCRGCGATYNGKSGRSNTTSIVIYSIIVFVIVFALSALVFWR
jgi:transposase-like protein